MSKIINKIKEEWNSYSKNIKITLIVLGILSGLFVIFGLQVLFGGLGYTGMDNVFAWAQWIIGDLGLVALGGGAFFTGFILYIFRVDKLEPIINSAVLVGFLCYLFTFVFLLFDLGQPLRFWFGFAYPNWGPSLMPKSMLTEVFFCLTAYFMILFVEMIPIALKHKVLDKYPVIHGIGHYMHKIMWIFAAAGTFLSFFHQGSLGGGAFGVLYAKPGWFRLHFFYMAIVAATAGGTSFMAVVAWFAGKVMKKEVVPIETFSILLRISGAMFVFYGAFRVYDLMTLIYTWVPTSGRTFTSLWGGYYGLWMLVLELLALGGAIILLNMIWLKNNRLNEKVMFAGALTGVFGIIVSKISVLMHGFSTPNFPWKKFAVYHPTIQEWSVTFGAFAIMALIYMWCAKYLPLFPHAEEKEDH